MTFHLFRYHVNRTFSDVRELGMARLKCELLGCQPDPDIEWDDDHRIASPCLHCGAPTDGPNHWEGLGILPLFKQQCSMILDSSRFRCWLTGCKPRTGLPDFADYDDGRDVRVECVRCGHGEGEMFEYFLSKSVWSRLNLALHHNWIHKRCRECPRHVWFTSKDWCTEAEREAATPPRAATWFDDSDCPF